MGQLEEKVAFITGASSGIGKTAAIKLAKEGAKIALIDVKEDNAKEVKETIETFDGSAVILECDISKPEEVEQSKKTISKKLRFQWNIQMETSH